MREFQVGDKVQPKPETTRQDFQKISVPQEVFDKVYEDGIIVSSTGLGTVMIHNPCGRGTWLLPASYFEFFNPTLPEHLFEI